LSLLHADECGLASTRHEQGLLDVGERLAHCRCKNTRVFSVKNTARIAAFIAF
jgi:hypothetical protein